MSGGSNLLRLEVIEYSCKVEYCKLHLSLEHWHVATYPLTYTQEECLEEFCERAGWEFLRYSCGYIGAVDILQCRVPTAHLVMDKIYWHHNIVRRAWHENCIRNL